MLRVRNDLQCSTHNVNDIGLLLDAVSVPLSQMKLQQEGMHVSLVGHVSSVDVILGDASDKQAPHNAPEHLKKEYLKIEYLKREYLKIEYLKREYLKREYLKREYLKREYLKR